MVYLVSGLRNQSITSHNQRAMLFNGNLIILEHIIHLNIDGMVSKLTWNFNYSTLIH